MNVLIAPANFKGSLSAVQAAKIIESGLHKTAPNIRTTVLPLADGGMGTADLLTRALSGWMINKQVTGPLGQPVRSYYGLANEPARSGPTAVIEMAQAAGLAMVPSGQRDPQQTTTRGVGELMRDALLRGCVRVIVGCGDSATIDCGIGALSALGVRFLDRQKRPIALNARGLNRLARIDRSGLMPQALRVQWIIACDVDNRLTGEKGALMYSRQKGADRRARGGIDKGLHNFKHIVRQQFGVDPDQWPGAGAAGGLPAGLAAVLGADLVSGFELYREIARLDRKIYNCDRVITGEGRLDEQTLRGKAVFGMVKLADKFHKPVIFFAGSHASSSSLRGFRKTHTILTLRKPRMTIREAMAKAPKLLMHNAMLCGQTLE